MSFEESDRKYIVNSHLQVISGIADRNYQERVWVRGEGPEFDDYTETICFFFDNGDPIIKNYKEYNITNEQISSLIKLREVLEKFNDETIFDLGPNFLDSQEWISITHLAKEVLRAFNHNEFHV